MSTGTLARRLGRLESSGGGGAGYCEKHGGPTSAAVLAETLRALAAEDRARGIQQEAGGYRHRRRPGAAAETRPDRPADSGPPAACARCGAPTAAALLAAAVASLAAPPRPRPPTPARRSS